MAHSTKKPDLKKYDRYAEAFPKLVRFLEKAHGKDGAIELEYLNGRYWCKLLDFDAQDNVTARTYSLEMTVQFVSHMKALVDDFQDGKVKLTLGRFTMLANVGEVLRKKQKDKSYIYKLELSWSF